MTTTTTRGEIDSMQSDDELRVRVRAWLAENATPVEEDETDDTELGDVVEQARSTQRSLHDHGLAGLTWPKEYGGQGLGASAQRIWNEEAATFVLPQARVLAVGLGMCGPTILQLGSERQKERFVRPLLRGDELWCQMFSEPGAGSDVASLQMRAVRDGDTWVLNGQKVWTSGAHYCDYGIVIARSDPTVPKHQGISMFIVDMRTKGITIRPLRQMNGAANFNEVFFEDVAVPVENMIGAPGEGWRAAVAMLMNERVAIGGGRPRGVNAMNLLELMRERAVDAPVLRDAVVDLYVRERVTELTVLRAQAKARAGQVPGPEGSVAKLAGSQLNRRRADLATAIVGFSGVAWESSTVRGDQWAQMLMSAPGSAIAGGTDQIQRNIIGERVLGLPREPQVDREVPFRDLTVGTQR